MRESLTNCNGFQSPAETAFAWRPGPRRGPAVLGARAWSTPKGAPLALARVILWSRFCSAAASGILLRRPSPTAESKPMPTRPPRLIVRDASGNDRELEIARTPFTLGRQGDNELVLFDNRISRRHARIIKDERGYVLQDTESRHGTFVNGER